MRVKSQRAASSKDGLRFQAREEILGTSYWRVFDWEGYRYALAMPGRVYRSQDRLTAFESGPTLFSPNMGHATVYRRGSVLQVFYSNAGDCPEHILLSTIELTADWSQWHNSDPTTVLEPQMDYEGANLPLLPSKRGMAQEPVRQLRDPCIFEEAGKTYLLYSVAGERGIAIAELLEAE